MFQTTRKGQEKAHRHNLNQYFMKYRVHSTEKQKMQRITNVLLISTPPYSDTHLSQQCSINNRSAGEEPSLDTYIQRPRGRFRRMSIINSFVIIDTSTMRRFSPLLARLRWRNAPFDSRRARGGLLAARFSQPRANLLCALHHAAVDARIFPRRNNRSFNSDAGSLSLSPVKRGPAFRHRSRPRLYFAPCFSRRALYYRRDDDLQNKPSPFVRTSARSLARLTFARLAQAAFIKCTN